MMAYERISLDNFEKNFSGTAELSSVASGGEIISVSDEFFAEAFHLLLVEPAPSMKGQFGPNGALYSGWETRRHNPKYDWCILQLGTSGIIHGFDIDTANFNGNEAPQVSVEILYGLPTEKPQVDDARWMEVLPKVNIGPDAHHFFKIPPSSQANFVKLNMYPDGGIGRFRVYGEVLPVFPPDNAVFDLAHMFAGGRVVYTSDQHFGVGANLILPGRGKDMGDGWETKRSRVENHKDWVVIKLGTPGCLETVEIDTVHFKGNFPESCEMHALFNDSDLNWATQIDSELPWTIVLPRKKLGPDQQHYFPLENVQGKTYTHIKCTIYPDGGLKRVRVLGRRAEATVDTSVAPSAAGDLLTPTVISPTAPSNVVTVPVLPLTPEAFAPFGQVIQAYSDHSATPDGISVTEANGGTAVKFHKLSLLSYSYPEGTKASSGISVYRCKPLREIDEKGTAPLTVLERHPYTNQAFIPMGNRVDEETGRGYLVVVAQNGTDDRPNTRTLKAFRATNGQGVVYNTAIWHQPMTVLGHELDLACVETQIGDGSALDCEIVELDGSYRLEIGTL